MQIIALIFAFCIVDVYVESKSENEPRLLIISLDGFRWDYLDRMEQLSRNISAFKKLWHKGFRVKKVKNEFATKTFPNHWTIMTGLYEESHGIVGNDVYDPKYNETVNLRREELVQDPKWFYDRSEPLWLTNQKAGHSSGVAFWPGMNAGGANYTATHILSKYDGSISFRTRIGNLLNWFDNNHINLGIIYTDEPDLSGHRHGSNSVEVIKAIEALNSDLEYLWAEIDKREYLKKTLNIFIVSDHGMSETRLERIIVLTNYTKDIKFTTPDTGQVTVMNIWPTGTSTADDIYNALHDKHMMMTVYRKEDVPKRLRYKNHRRIGPIVVVCEPGWLVSSGKINMTKVRAGHHGYDNKWDEMAPFMLAAGPKLVQLSDGGIVNSMKMIDFYPLFCEILDLKNPAPNNGSISRVRHLLRHKDVEANGSDIQ